MATLLSDTFLTIHPATELWWQQREQCQRCAHVSRRLEGTQKEQSEVLRCQVVRTPLGRRESAYCIDARATGECGPEAKLFQEKT
jgi:hypothetical protein